MIALLLKYSFKNNEYIIVPDVYEDHKDFIIMEYIEGKNIENFYQECIENDIERKTK